METQIREKYMRRCGAGEACFFQGTEKQCSADREERESVIKDEAKETGRQARYVLQCDFFPGAWSFGSH